MKTVRNLCLYAVAMLLVTGTSARAIEWQSDYGSALESARLAKKPLLVILELPSDRGSDDAASEFVGEALLNPYEICRVDVSTPLGKKVADAFGAKQFPYTVITDRDQKNVIFRKAGHQSEGDWTSLLMEYRNGEKPVKETYASFPSVGSTVISTDTYSNPPFMQSLQSDPAVCFT